MPSPAPRPRRPHTPWLTSLLMVAAPLSCALASCAANELPEPKPKAPDTSALLTAYATPTLALTADTAAALTADLAALLNLATPLCGWDSAADLVCADPTACGTSCGGLASVFSAITAAATTQAEDPNADPNTQAQPLLATRRDPLSLQGEGFLRVKRTCGGWGATPTPDRDAHGLIELVVGFSDSGLDQVIWGEFKRCKEKIGGEDVLIDGDVTISFTAPTTFEALSQGLSSLQLVVQLSARTLEVGGQTLSGDLDFSILPARPLIEVKLDANGQHLLLVSDAGQLGIRAANGDWTCDLSAAQCTRVGSADTLGVNLP